MAKAIMDSRMVSAQAGGASFRILFRGSKFFLSGQKFVFENLWGSTNSTIQVYIYNVLTYHLINSKGGQMSPFAPTPK